MGTALCGCLVLAAVLVGARYLRSARQRTAEAAKAAADKNALDLGLALLIKDISRPQVPQATRTIAPRPLPMVLPRTRPARGTPSEAIATSARLRTLTTPAPTPIPSRLADLFSEDEDDAPTTHARAYIESPSVVDPVRVVRR